MKIYDEILKNPEYLTLVQQIENTKFITDGKWDWEHGLGHYQRVANYVKSILSQLGCNERTIELGMITALLHDIGLSKGDKIDHALESSKIFKKYLNENDFSKDELLTIEQAIKDHSKGNNIDSLIGLALILGDKLDVTYHRTINSSIQDKTNKEFQKINSVDIIINDNDLIVNYSTNDDFDKYILNNWDKTLLIPKKVADYLNKEFKFKINNQLIDYREIINQNTKF